MDLVLEVYTFALDYVIINYNKIKMIILLKGISILILIFIVFWKLFVILIYNQVRCKEVCDFINPLINENISFPLSTQSFFIYNGLPSKKASKLEVFAGVWIIFLNSVSENTISNKFLWSISIYKLYNHSNNFIEIPSTKFIQFSDAIIFPLKIYQNSLKSLNIYPFILFWSCFLFLCLKSVCLHL